MKNKWEYHFIDADENNIVNEHDAPAPNACEFYEYANELGKQGWELVTVGTHPDVPGYRYYFKRPLPESSDQSKPGQPS